MLTKDKSLILRNKVTENNIQVLIISDTTNLEFPFRIVQKDIDSGLNVETRLYKYGDFKKAVSYFYLIN